MALIKKKTNGKYIFHIVGLLIFLFSDPVCLEEYSSRTVQ